MYDVVSTQFSTVATTGDAATGNSKYGGGAAVDDAWLAMEGMQQAGVRPDATSWRHLIQACARAKLRSSAADSKRAWTAHPEGRPVRVGPRSRISTGQARRGAKSGTNSSTALRLEITSKSTCFGS